ncbi:MAG: DUF58 domain-containing protein [Chloroflexi bacterium HGW-Chloroflexi-6]|nr:MAG: DUF58 domain-containing protein [Chloroflexi bacterium HGW-Chloroflexi-6]
MSRAFLVSALAFLFIAVGLASLEARLLILALPLVIYLVAGLWNAPAELNLTITRKMSAWRIAQGESVQVTLTATNHGADLQEVLIEDLLPEGMQIADGFHRRLVSIASGASVSWTYALTGKRGYYMLHRVRVTAREPFGLASASQVLPTDGQLFVVPPVLRLRHIPIRPRRTRIFSGSILARQGGPGLEFFDVRDYQTGDSSRSINWRLTARHPQGIYSNQYEQERVVDVGIILDGRRCSNEIGDRSIFEHSVMAAAALSNAFLSAGNRVGMLFYGKQIRWTLPGYGKIQGEKILHDLSGLEPGESQNFNELHIPRNRFPTRSQLVLVSSLIPDDFRSIFDLRSQGYAVLVVSPDPVSFEISGGASSDSLSLALRIIQIRRQLFLDRLRGIGVPIVNWDVSLPFEQVARRALERRQIFHAGGRL